MTILITWLGKSIALGLSLIHRKGTALPGLIIERIYPRYLNRMLDQLPKGVIIITGTNGKTTTTKVITELLESTGLRVLTNSSGGNFVRGVIATISKQATLSGKLHYDVGVFEQDEAHSVKFAARYQPTGVVALNVMRDQMDRFGEIDSTAKFIGKLVARAKSWVVLNANDRRIAGLAPEASKKARIHWFGHAKNLQQLFIDDDQLYSDEPTFYEAAKPEIELTKLDGNELTFRMSGAAFSVSGDLDGTHNAMNAAAALAAFHAMLPDVAMKVATDRLATVRPAFGRGELVRMPHGTLRLQLVKNPAGFRHGLHGIHGQNLAAVAIVINDDYADGRDVSWLWDVDFTALKGHAKQLLCGGTRAADMAVRLKYDDLAANVVEPDLDLLIEKIANVHGSSIVFCTYTAMLAIRKRLKQYDNRLHEEGL